MVRIKEGEYIAIIDEERMVEVHADTAKEAKEKIEEIYDGDIRVCKIPSIISYIGR